MSCSIHPDWVRRQRAARHTVVLVQGICTLAAGQVCAALGQAMHALGVDTAALLTLGPRPEGISDALVTLAARVGAFGLTALPAERDAADGEAVVAAGFLVPGIAFAQAETLAREFGENGLLWVNDRIGLPVLKLVHPLQVPGEGELAIWRAALAADEAGAASLLPGREQALLMTVPAVELRHWLLPDLRDISRPWPLARPDGGAMGSGSELDRIFRLVAAGISPAVCGFVDG